MAAVIRLLRPSSCSLSLSLSLSLVRRSLSTAAVTETVKSETYPQYPLPTTGHPKSSRNVQWVFLGSPGVGKGTYASRLSTLLGVPHIATGDLVREELASGSSLAKQLAEIVKQGKLVSDEIIIDLLSKRLEAGEGKGELVFILDGFPTTVRQAVRLFNWNSTCCLLPVSPNSVPREILDEVTEIDLVVNLRLQESVLVEKCLGRRICSQCGKNFNVASIDVEGENGSPGISMPPLLPPPQCVSKLITRADDTEDVVRERLRIYNDKVPTGLNLETVIFHSDQFIHEQ